jgi:hypothetical protein
VVHERGVAAIEVMSTHQVVPTIKSLDSPPRIVIDLANARAGVQSKKTPVLEDNLLTLRTEQYQKDPPITRVVLDLLVPYGYTWDIAGNRLMVRLKAPENPNVAAKKTPSQTPKAISLAPSGGAAVVPVTSGVGDVVLAGSRFAAGSSVTAGSTTTVLQLARGGEVRVCPGTTVSVTPSKSAKDLMLGMSSGALETHYSLDASADTVLTPDFRILFAGPGEFHYAVSTDSQGNTCVRGLAGNSSSAIVSELIGERVYQVKPSEQAVFRSGRIDKVDTNVPLECGCPPPVRVERADASQAHVIPDSASPNITLADTSSTGSVSKPDSGSTGGGGDKDAGRTLSNGPETQPLPPSQGNEVHVQVDAPLVFQSNKTSAALAAPAKEVATLPVMEASARTAQLEVQALPPPSTAEAKPERRGLLRRIQGFFGKIFR